MPEQTKDGGVVPDRLTRGAPPESTMAAEEGKA